MNRWTSIGYLIILHRLGIVILTASQLVPLILIRHTIAVSVKCHHHDTWLRRATLTTSVIGYVAIKGIALDEKVFLSRHIHHSMVETKGYISAVCSQGYHDIVHQVVLSFLSHGFLIVTIFIKRHRIYKLSWCWPILIHLGSIWTVLRILMHHRYGEIMAETTFSVIETKR